MGVFGRYKGLNLNWNPQSSQRSYGERGGGEDCKRKGVGMRVGSGWGENIHVSIGLLHGGQAHAALIRTYTHTHTHYYSSVGGDT